MASNKKKSQSEDETIEQEDGIESSREAGDENAAETDHEAGEEAPEAAVEGVTLNVKVDATQTGGEAFDGSDCFIGIHLRLTKEARALSTHGGHERVHALNQLELLTGQLKMVLPSGIAATEDDALRAGLELLLGIL